MGEGKVEVLLSTYNGEKYIWEQLMSIEAQTVRNRVTLRIRDDGSVDETPKLLHKYSRDRRWVVYRRGRNIGVVRSFFALLGDVSRDTDYVAFCDQDDIWHEDKLERAINKLRHLGSSVPALYFCRTRLVNGAGAYIGLGNECRKPVGLENALVENVATGCTVVLNRRAIDLLSEEVPDLQKVVMHDWWMYLVVSAFGVVVYDERPNIDYRQHGGNVVGVRHGLGRWLWRVRRFLVRNRRELVDQVGELLRTYGDKMPEGKRRLCEEFVGGAGADSVWRRFLYVRGAPIYRQSLLDTVIMRALVVLGWR